MKVIAALIMAAGLATPPWADTPPFGNTVYLEPDVVTADDPSAFQTIQFIEKVTDEEYSDNCDGNFVSDNFYVFEAGYSRGQTVDF